MHRFGAKTVWIIRICMVLLAPVAWPLAFILNKVHAFLSTAEQYHFHCSHLPCACP